MAPRRTLREQLATPTTLEVAWSELNQSNPESRGLSGLTLDQYKQALHQNLRRLASDLQADRFRFSELRGTTIPKPGKPGQRRPLRVQEIQDRVVSRAIVNLIEPTLRKRHRLVNDVSFAYTKGRGVRDAIARVIELYREQRPWLFEADIQGFFDNVDRDRLLREQVFPYLRDDSINDLIRAAISAPVGNLADLPPDRASLFSDAGIPQGGALSPLLANVFLAPFDRKMQKRRFALVRYADDFVLLCKSREEALAAHLLAKAILEDDLGLQLHPLEDTRQAKTRIIRVTQSFTFLGATFDGHRLAPSSKALDSLSFRLSLATDVTSRTTERKTTVLDVLRATRLTLAGWVTAHAHTDIQAHAAKIDDRVNGRLASALRLLGWRHRRGKSLTDDERRTSGVPFVQELLDDARTGQFDAGSRYAAFPDYWPPQRPKSGA